MLSGRVRMCNTFGLPSGCEEKNHDLGFEARAPNFMDKDEELKAKVVEIFNEVVPAAQQRLVQD